MKTKETNLMTKHLIAIHGKMGAGKDYLANLLTNSLPKSRQLSFAGTLKKYINLMLSLKRNGQGHNALAQILGVPEDAIDHIFNDILPSNLDKVDAYVKTPEMRKLYQYFGDVKREQEPNFFVDKTIERALSLLSKKNIDHVIISDVRFPNEYDAVLHENALFIHLDVPTGTRHARILARDGFAPSNESENHPSETALDNIKRRKDTLVFTGDESDTDMLVKVQVSLPNFVHDI